MTTKESDIYEKLLNVAEAFYYADRFRGQKVILVFNNVKTFFELIEDVNVILHAKIDLTIVFTCSLSQQDIEAIQSTNSVYMISEFTVDNIVSISDQHKIPLIFDSSNDILEVIHNLNNLVEKIDIKKVILINIFPKILLKETEAIHYTCSQIKELILQSNKYKPLAVFFETELNTDLVLLRGNAGELFKELFTHLGTGVLITDNYSISFCPAEKKHISDVYNLLMVHQKQDIILPILEHEISHTLSDYYVLLVNDAVVACTRVKDYDEALEIGKLCVLPRYRGLGLAKRLVQETVKIKASGNKYFFAVSKNYSAQVLFLSLGFQECDRKQLPASWQKGYDFSRPSKAYRLNAHS